MATSLVASELATKALISRYFGAAVAAAATSLSSAAPRMAQAHAPAGSSSGPLLAHGDLVNPGQPRGGVPAFAGGASGPIRFLSMFGRKTDRVDPILAAAFSSTSEL